MSIKVLLTERNIGFREGVRSVLQKEADFDIVGEANNNETLFHTINHLSPTVLVLEVGPNMFNIIELIRKVANDYTDIKMVVVSIYPNKRVVESVLNAGACGYVLKHRVSEELAKAIRLAASDLRFLSPEIDILKKSYPRPVLHEGLMSC